MAKSKINTEVSVNENTNTIENTVVTENATATVVTDTPVTTGNSQPSMEDFMVMFAQMQNTINSLQQKLEDSEKKNQEMQASASTTVTDSIELPVTADRTSEILERLVNKKSEREVILVHNREMLGGLTTAIRLTGLNIDFHTMGEQRILTWQQAEECVSQYYSLFKNEVILLGPGCEDLAERYNVPCIGKKETNITRKDIENISAKSEKELENFVNSLTDEDKEFIYSYWLGKCYEKDERFINRSKIELLNHLSGTGVFDTFITGMNFSSVNNR